MIHVIFARRHDARRGRTARLALVSACGQTMANINNILALIARKAIDKQIRSESSELTWYEHSVIVRQGFDILRYWTPTYVAYTSFLFALAILASIGELHDFMIFAVAITFVNIFVLSYSQATMQGPILRGNLSQYAIAGENIRLGSTGQKAPGAAKPGNSPPGGEPEAPIKPWLAPSSSRAP